MFYLTAHLKILQYFSFLCLTDSINPKIRLLRSIYLVSTSRGGGGGGGGGGRDSPYESGGDARRLA